MPCTRLANTLIFCWLSDAPFNEVLIWRAEKCFPHQRGCVRREWVITVHQRAVGADCIAIFKPSLFLNVYGYDNPT